VIRLLLKLLFLSLILNGLVAAQTADQCPSCTVIGGHLVSGGHVTLGNFGGNLISPGWLFLQGTSGTQNGGGGSFQVQNACGASITSTCTIKIQPTTLGSVRSCGLAGNGADNLTITSCYDCTVSSGCNAGNALDTYSLCAGGVCHINDVTDNGNLDAAYKAGGAANATFVTINLSGTPANSWFMEFMEMAAPNCGGTPCATSFDTNVTMHASTGNCSTLCTLGGMTLSGTDGIIGIIDSSSTVGSFNAPYQIDSVGNVFATDASSAPALTVKTSGIFILTNIAFKSSAGIYITNPNVFTNRFPAPGDTTGNALSYQLNCSPTCSLTLPGTSVNGDLLFLSNGANAVNATISSISGAGTWVIPTAANTCQNTTVSGNPLGCGWVLSSTSGATTISITMSTNCTSCNFFLMDIGRTSGSFVLDAQNSSSVATGVNPVVGQTLALTGTVDVCFVEAEWTSNTPFEYVNQYYPLPGGKNEFGTPGILDQGIFGAALNVRSFQTQNVLLSATPTNSTTSAVCFK
jgi:hypothetical protein